MPLKYIIKSHLWNDLFILNRILYEKDRKSDERIFWRCNTHIVCLGRVHIIQGQYIV